ncbi:hypothetical protein ATANTOWER_029704 [Ataeniobius toweri]|uniref:Uncharacterized protein n=1 Tax=Ataeniobius toweri TaxID=208326 RepID=A0ABU7A348_9TELE|nr:hypothetical protein [Ataeniobius toweri]
MYYIAENFGWAWQVFVFVAWHIRPLVGLLCFLTESAPFYKLRDGHSLKSVLVYKQNERLEGTSWAAPTQTQVLFLITMTPCIPAMRLRSTATTSKTTVKSGLSGFCRSR